MDEVDEVECSKCGKTTSAKYVYASTCLNCVIKDRMLYSATTPSGLSGYRRGGMIYHPTYASNSSNPEEITYYTWGGIPTHKVSPPPSEEAEAEVEAEVEKSEYDALYEDLRNLRDQSQISALKKLHEDLSSDHDRWIDKYASERDGSSSSSYVSGVISGIGEAMHKIAQMIEVIENDA